jgi:hypothetical protein
VDAGKWMPKKGCSKMGWGQDIVSRKVFTRVWAGLVNIRNDLPAAFINISGCTPQKAGSAENRFGK